MNKKGMNHSGWSELSEPKRVITKCVPLLAIERLLLCLVTHPHATLST